MLAESTSLTGCKVMWHWFRDSRRVSIIGIATSPGTFLWGTNGPQIPIFSQGGVPLQDRPGKFVQALPSLWLSQPRASSWLVSLAIHSVLSSGPLQGGLKSPDLAPFAPWRHYGSTAAPSPWMPVAGTLLSLVLSQRLSFFSVLTLVICLPL